MITPPVPAPDHRAPDQRPATHLATVRGWPDIPVRKEGHFWWCSYSVDLGIVWGPRDVRDIRPIPGEASTP